MEKNLMTHEQSMEILLDVSDLEPPEPLVMVLEAAEKLQAGQFLHMLHRRDPCMLYGHLDEGNFLYRQRKGTVSSIEVFIWRKGDDVATALVTAIMMEPA